MERQHLSQTKKAIAPPQTQSHMIARYSPHPIEELQGAIGNRAVNQLLANQPPLPRKPLFRGLSQEFRSDLMQINQPIQAKKVDRASVSEAQTENKTGLPDNLKVGIENLSGIAMDDVRVHYNSSQPSELQALAYTQGIDIHVAPGQEQHLPHEAWHFVQQIQGRVKPTIQTKGVGINDDPGLEKEADVMGSKALQMKSDKSTFEFLDNRGLQNAGVIQTRLNWNRQRLEKEAGAKTGQSEEYKNIVRIIDTYNTSSGHASLASELTTLYDLRRACKVWLNQTEDQSSAEIQHRRQSIQELVYLDLPREISTLRGKYNNGTKKGVVGTGQVAPGGVESVNYIIDGKATTRAFKLAVDSYDDNLPEVAQEARIPKDKGSLMSNRSVATSLLDKLFKTNVIVDTSFATRLNDDQTKAEYGIAMEMAEGIQPKKEIVLKTKDPDDQEMRLSFARNIDYRDPELQKQLSTLQLLDAVTGQVDRHVGNYFVSQGEPGGTKVKGIDNDFAFGVHNKYADKPTSKWDKLRNFPTFVDATVAQNIRNITEADIRNLLEDLLPKAEVEATIFRFQNVLKYLEILESIGRLLTGNQWNNMTAEQHDENSYLEVMKANMEEKKYKGMLLPSEPGWFREASEKEYMDAYSLLVLVEKTPFNDLKEGKFGGLYEFPAIKNIPDLRKKVLNACAVIEKSNPSKWTQGFMIKIKRKVFEELDSLIEQMSYENY